MHLKVLILGISFVATAGLPVLQNTDSTRTEPLWDYSSHKANQAADKMELTKEVETWKSSLETSDPYGDPYAHDASRGQGAADLQRKLSLESQRLRERLAHELRDLRERLAAAFAGNPAPSPAPRRPLARRLADDLHAGTRQLCSRLARHSRGPEAAAEEAARGTDRALGEGERELAARLAEFQAAAAGGRGDPAGALRRETEAFGAAARGRAQALRAGLAAARTLGEGLSELVEQFCRAAEEENRLFVGRIERQMEALGQSEGQAQPPSVSPSGTGSLGEDFSPKLSALLQDILQTLN